MVQRSGVIGARADRWLRAHPGLVDSAGALLLLIAVLPSSVVLGAAATLAPAGLQITISLAMVAVLALRRVAPTASSATVYGLALLHLLLGVPSVPGDVAVPFACYAAAVYAPRWAGWTALGGAMVGSLLFGAVTTVVTGSADLLQGGALSVGSGAVLLATWALGQWRRIRRAYVVELVERARRLEAEREQESRLAAAGERARIAREMHDVVAHSLSVMIAQADGGRYAAAASPEAAVRALETVSSTGRAALADMRRLLGVLRDGGERAAMAPQPTVADVPELVSTIAASGLDVTCAIVGHPRPMGSGAGLAGYRIVQESLTNVLKHAGPGVRARVVVRWTDRAVELQVDDDGRGASAPADGAGQGLAGMRERVQLHGGTLEAGPRHAGGFRVLAVLPWTG